MPFCHICALEAQQANDALAVCPAAGMGFSNGVGLEVLILIRTIAPQYLQNAWEWFSSTIARKASVFDFKTWEVTRRA